MIYFLSDLHGKAHKTVIEYQETAKEDDLLILLGDILLNFEDTEENKAFTEYILSSKKPVAIVDGNHENYEYLFNSPEEEWNGGIVTRLAENVIYLKRGQIYTIEGKKFFVLGGWRSSAKWKEAGLWSPLEEASTEELEFAYENLAKHGYSVDYVITHQYERDAQPEPKLSMEGINHFIKSNVEYKMWYFGHHHREFSFDPKHVCVYKVLRPLDL